MFSEKKVLSFLFYLSSNTLFFYTNQAHLIISKKID